jgi:dolichol-phosphate mannosyltransferase
MSLKNLVFAILEIPIYFEDRRIGQSKMSMPVKIEAALRVFEIRWRHSRYTAGHVIPSFC